MPPRPSRGPTSLHLASLGSPFALLTDPPPPRFTSLSSRRILPAVFPPPAPRPSRVDPALRSSRPHARAHETERERETRCRGAPSFLFLLSHGRFLSFSSAAPLARASTSPTLSPFSSCFCSLFLLSRPHRAFSSTVRVREHSERLFVSPRPSPSLSLILLLLFLTVYLSLIFSLSVSPPFLPSFFFLFHLSFLLTLLPPPLPSSSTHSPRSLALPLSCSVVVDSLSTRGVV